MHFWLGNAYAEQISAATDRTVDATAAETGASVQNIQQLVSGTYQVAVSLAKRLAFLRAACLAAGREPTDLSLAVALRDPHVDDLVGARRVGRRRTRDLRGSGGTNRRLIGMASAAGRSLDADAWLSHNDRVGRAGTYSPNRPNT